MKQELFFNEILLISYHLKVENFWCDTVKEFTQITLNENDLDIQFYNQISDFGYLVSLLSNELPIFSNLLTEQELKSCFDRVELSYKIPLNLQFLWNKLFFYLKNLNTNISSHGIEVTEISDFIDNILFFVKSEFNA